MVEVHPFLMIPLNSEHSSRAILCKAELETLKIETVGGLFWSLWGRDLMSQYGQSSKQELERLRIGPGMGYFGFVGSAPL